MLRSLLRPHVRHFPATAGVQSVQLERFLIVLILVVFAVRGALVFRLNVNWDEFFYLSHIYSYARGELPAQLQMFHVHLFGWLTAVPGNEVNQIVAGRLVMLALSATSSVLIYCMAREHFSRAVALLCVLCYVCFSEVVRHGTSFRADSLYAPLVLTAAYAAMRSPRSTAAPVIGGLAAALALMVTIKTALFLPVIGALFLVRLWHDGMSRESVRPPLVFAGVLVPTFAALFALHDALVPTLATDVDMDLVKHSYNKAISHGDFFPRWHVAIVSLIGNLLSWTAIVCGIAIALRGVVRQKRLASLRDLDVLCLALPLTTLLFYRNAFPYFYVLLVGFVVIAAGVTVEYVIQRWGRSRDPSTVLWICGIVLTGLFLVGVVRSHATDETRGEQELLAAVHRVFPEPVPYIDRCSMVSSFPKVGLFMSTWGLEVYRAGGRPVMRTLIESKQPRFLIVNSESLDISGPYEKSGISERFQLLREDFDVLKDNFIPHWGRLFVAGKRVTFGRDSSTRTVEILIEGTYTIEGSAVIIDGVAAPAGSKVKLNKGRYTMSAVATPATAVLRWGADLYRPEGEPPSMIFTGL